MYLVIYQDTNLKIYDFQNKGEIKMDKQKALETINNMMSYVFTEENMTTEQKEALSVMKQALSEQTGEPTNVKKEPSLDELADAAIKIAKLKPDCEACGMGIACCGCPKDREYRKRYKQFEDKIGSKKWKAVYEYAALKQKFKEKSAEIEKIAADCAKAIDKCTSMGLK